MLVGDHRNDSISILPCSVHCTLMQSIFHFLQTLLVTVQWENWFPFQLNHRLYMHMYNTAQHKCDLCKPEWLKKVVVYHIRSKMTKMKVAIRFLICSDKAIGLEIASLPLPSLT